jgi:thiamine biosynthesis protein ThiS
MTLTVNGERRDLPEGLSLEALLRALELPGERVAVELNRELVPRARFSEAALREGDKVEIVHFVGGG